VTVVRLVGTELRRFTLRRAVRWLVGLSLLLALVINGVQLARSSEGTTYQRAQLPTLPTDCRTGEHDGLPVIDQSCLEQGNGVLVEPGSVNGKPADVYFASPADHRVRAGRTFEDTIAGMGIALALLGVLIGSSFLAAEFGASGFGTQLLFEPRRWRLYGAKVAAVAIGCGVVAVLLVAWTGLGQLVASALRGSTAGVDAGWLLDRAGNTSRTVAACALAAVCALAVGALARRTVVAVGIFFGVVIATGFLINTSWGRPIAKLSPMNGIFAVASGDFSNPDTWGGLHTIAGALLVAGAWALGLSVVAGWWLSRAEIR
jgi:ABC-2 type transport system permease protein